jgi:outer membrane protein assembly factor BamB
MLLSGLVFPLFGEETDFERDQFKNWHHWRGPTANGVAVQGNPPLTWSETQNIQWKTPIPGDGSGTPIVWGDRVFVTTAVRTDRAVAELAPPAVEPPGGYRTERPKNYYRFVVLCLNRRDGRILWQRTATEALPHEGHHPSHGYASGSPTTDGQRLYVSFGSRGIYAYLLDGTPLWNRDLGDLITRLGWGEANTPVIHRGALVVNWDHEGQSAIYVLDAKTGAIRWQASRDEVSSWATPLVVEHAGRTQVIVSATRRITSYDLSDGSIIWECGGQTVNCIPSPVTRGGVVFCMSGFRGNALFAIPLDVEGDLTGSDQILWQRDRGTPYVPSPVLMDDLLYFTSSNSAVLTCLDAGNGETVIEPTRLPGLRSLYASPTGAGDRIYIVGREGTTLVIKKGSPFEVLATNVLDEGIDGSPAIVGNQILLRGHSHVYCLSEE